MIIKNAIKKTPLYAESWNVAYRNKPQGSILSDTETPFTIIKNHWRYWAADPFVIENNGVTYIFAELYDYVKRRGVIGYCVLNEKKCKWTPVITEPFHLSYPCLIFDKDHFYIMPESGEKKELILYRAVNFPDKWKKNKVIRENISLADTTPIRIKDSTFALTHNVDIPTAPKLMVIDLKNQHKDTIVEKYVAFRSRPAGNTFIYNGLYIRPSQLSSDCGDGYGKGLIFNKFYLDENMRYNEDEIKVVIPQELRFNKSIYLCGMHTYNATMDLEVIDVKTRRLSLINLFFRVIGKFFRKL